MGYSYEQLKQMGATPGATPGASSNISAPKKSYTYDELVNAGATPGATPKEVEQKPLLANSNAPFKYNKDDSTFKSTLKTIGNVPSSAIETGKGLFGAVAHPIKTTKGLGSIVVGGVQKLIPGEQEQEKTFDSVVDFFKERYGSVEKFERTITEDPTGFALDLSSIFSGGGILSTKVGSLSKINRATKAANVAARVAARNSVKAGVAGSSEALRAAKQISNIGKANTFTKVGGALTKAGDVVNPIAQGTRLFGKGVSTLKGKKIGGKKYTTDNLDATSNIGITPEELPIFAKTTSPIATTAEAVASKGIGGGKIWSRMTNIYIKMNNTVDDLLKGNLDASVIGRNLSAAVDDYKNKFYEQKNKLYKEAIIPKPKIANIEIPGYENIKNVIVSAEDSLFSAWNKKILPDGRVKYTKPIKPVFSGKQISMPASTVKTQKLLKSLIENEKQALKGYGTKASKELKTYEGLMKGLSDKNMTTSDVYRTLQKLERDIKFGTTVKTGNNAKLSLIHETLDGEFLTTLQRQRPDLAEALAKADDFYKQGVSKLNSSVIQTIVKNADKPDLIVKTLLPKLNSIEDVKLLVEVLGQKNMAELRKSIMTEIFTEAKGVANENLQPLGISKQVKKFGEDKLEILLNPDQLKAVKDLEQVSKMMGKSSKITGGSQTSFNLLSTVGGGSIATALTLLFMGNPTGAILSLSPLFGTIAASKFINSNLGRRLLTEGLKFTGKTGQKIQAASKPVGTFGQISNIYNSQR